jgi:ribonuclease P/MRP protein subunit POP3
MVSHILKAFPFRKLTVSEARAFSSRPRDNSPSPMHVSFSAGIDSITCSDQLHRLLEPLGRHREQHTSPSKGKRSKKRKRKDTQATEAPVESFETPPEPPRIKSHITIGFNSTTRHLEALSSKSVPSAISDHLRIKRYTTIKREGKDSLDSIPNTHLAAVFVPKSGQQAVIHAHLPLMLKTASMAAPEAPQTQLVPLSKSAEARLATALGVPRVGVLGLMGDAPDAGALIEVIREKLEPMEVPWLEQALAADYLTPRYVVYDPSLKVT